MAGGLLTLNGVCRNQKNEMVVEADAKMLVTYRQGGCRTLAFVRLAPAEY